MKEYLYNSINFKVGQSAEENWKLILKSARTDQWIHAEGRPSAHVIIEYDDITTDDIKYGCNLCAEQTKITTRPVLFQITSVSNLKLGSKPGEVIIRDEAKASYYLLQ